MNTAREESTDRLTEDDVIGILEDHGILWQMLPDKIQAYTEQTEGHAPGGFRSEWVDVKYDLQWLEAFLGGPIILKG